MRRHRALIPAALVAGLGIGVGIGAAGRELVGTAIAQPRAAAPAALSDDEANVVRIARQVSPAVVSVARPGASGSGVIVRRDGVMVTNAHVVGTARQVQVSLADGRTVVGAVLGRDPTIDIAVVRIPVTNAPVAPIGDSDRLEVGQSAIAIGNPLGLERTVTTGVVSAINRSPRGIQLEGLIQTDAAINPGNSGGPILDSRGQVIGISTAVLAGTGVSGLGFAVPINLANSVVEQLLTTGRITRPFLGILPGDIEPELAAQFGLPVREGVIVLQVTPGSPAQRAGLRVQDIITRVNDTPIMRGGDLRRALRELGPGAMVTISVLRPSGATTLRARLVEAPGAS